MVETFHKRIEKEHFDVERFDCLDKFMGKTWSFMLRWNKERAEIRTKKSPFAKIKEKCHIFDPEICNLPPMVVDEMEALVPDYRFPCGSYLADDSINQ